MFFRYFFSFCVVAVIAVTAYPTDSSDKIKFNSDSSEVLDFGKTYDVDVRQGPVRIKIVFVVMITVRLQINIKKKIPFFIGRFQR